MILLHGGRFIRIVLTRVTRVLGWQSPGGSAAADQLAFCLFWPVLIGCWWFGALGASADFGVPGLVAWLGIPGCQYLPYLVGSFHVNRVDPPAPAVDT